MRCYYDKNSCTWFSDVIQFDCKLCERYHNGVRETGDMPVLESIYNFLKKLFK